MLRWLFSKFYLICFSVFATLFFGIIISGGLFLVLEMYPDLLGKDGLSSVPYYALRHRYVADKELVIRNKPNSLYIGEVGNQAMRNPTLSEGFEPVPYRANFTGQGFRPPAVAGQITGVMIGDSFIEAGESDKSTLPALLSKAMNQNIKNLGTGWHGPDQYLIVLKRFGIPAKPNFAFFCFFEGNDIRDMAAFELYEKTNRYYDFTFHEASTLNRYFTVLKQGGQIAATTLVGFTGIPMPSFLEFKQNTLKTIHVSLGGTTFWDTFEYEPDVRPFEKMITDPQWRRIRSILKDFKEISVTAEIRPIVLFIPTKLTIYKNYATEQSGAHFKAIQSQQLARDGQSEKLLGLLASKAGIEFISLTNSLKEEAAKGSPPFYRFDPRWNRAGRIRAANYLSNYLTTARDIDKNTPSNNDGTAGSFDTPESGLRLTPPPSFEQ